MSDYVDITGRWGQRATEPDMLARQLAQCLTGLAAIDPLFLQWRRDGFRSQSAVPAFITLPPDREELRAWVVENAEFHAVAGRKRKTGYRVIAEAPRGNPLWTRLSLSTLDGDVPTWFDNRATITLLAEDGHEARLAPLVRPALLALATCFDCEWAAAEAAHYATPAGRKAGAGMLRYESGGMVYLTAPLAARIEPPADVGIEHLSSGAVLMTAAAVFDRNDAQHLAAAHRIQLALAPLNASSPPQSESGA